MARGQRNPFGAVANPGLIFPCSGLLGLIIITRKICLQNWRTNVKTFIGTTNLVHQHVHQFFSLLLQDSSAAAVACIVVCIATRISTTAPLITRRWDSSRYARQTRWSSDRKFRRFNKAAAYYGA